MGRRQGEDDKGDDMTNEIIDTTAIAVSDTHAPALFTGDTPAAVVLRMQDTAKALKGIIETAHGSDGQPLVMTLPGRSGKFVRCEGWTTLGAMLSVFPVTIWTRETENGWEARVEARTLSGQVVGAAEAMCARDEGKKWADAAGYALRSMAQTRATSKALRMPLGFVMTLAGYDATPAEEMTFDQPARSAVPQMAPPKCPEHGVCRYVPAGIGKATNKPFAAFYSCPSKECTQGPGGRGFIVNAEEWIETQKNLAAPRSGEVIDYDDVPNE